MSSQECCEPHAAKVAKGRPSLNTLRLAPRQWFCDYLPVTTRNQVDLYVDGKAYCSALYAGLKGARKTVVMTGLHFEPDFALVRGPDPVTLLEAIADCLRRGVKVRVLVNQFITQETGIVTEAEWLGFPKSSRGFFEPSDVKGYYLDANAWQSLSLLGWKQFFKKGELSGYFTATRRFARAFQQLQAEPGRHPAGALTLRTAIHCGEVFHSHHQKTVVIDDDVAFVGGIDLTDIDGDRWDTSDHDDAHRAVDRTNRYWHDIHARVQGGAVAYISANFEDRWNHDDTYSIEGGVNAEPVRAEPIGPPPRPQSTAPTPSAEPYRHRFTTKARPEGKSAVQVVRMMPSGRFEPGLQRPSWNRSTEDFERSCKDAYLNGIRAARKYIYLENQWITDLEIWSALAEAARCNKRRHNRHFRIVLVQPLTPLPAAAYPSGQVLWPADQAHSVISEALDSTTFGMYGLARPGGSHQIYVHSKILMVDDCWLLVGSANAGGTSMGGVVRPDQPDTELSLTILDPNVIKKFRGNLWTEHLGGQAKAVTDPASGADAMRAAASGPAPVGRIRFHPAYVEADEAADWLVVYARMQRQRVELLKRGAHGAADLTSRAIGAAADTVRSAQRKVEELLR